MPRYELTTQDRSKGGKTTAERHDMREIGKRGLETLAQKYFDGDTTRAGQTLSKIGNWRTDPARWNTAFTFPQDCPDELRSKVLSRWNDSSDGVPF